VSQDNEAAKPMCLNQQAVRPRGMDVASNAHGFELQQWESEVIWPVSSQHLLAKSSGGVTGSHWTPQNSKRGRKAANTSVASMAPLQLPSGVLLYYDAVLICFFA